MTAFVQLILTLLFYAWLAATMVLLWLVYRAIARYIRRMEETMLASRAISAQAAMKSAEAAAHLAELLREERKRHAP